MLSHVYAYDRPMAGFVPSGLIRQEQSRLDIISAILAPHIAMSLELFDTIWAIVALSKPEMILLRTTTTPPTHLN
jgi:hypothetical protein